MLQVLNKSQLAHPRMETHLFHLESIYQMGLKDNDVTSFRELAKHSEEIKDLVGRIEQQLKQREWA